MIHHQQQQVDYDHQPEVARSGLKEARAEKPINPTQEIKSTGLVTLRRNINKHAKKRRRKKSNELKRKHLLRVVTAIQDDNEFEYIQSVQEVPEQEISYRTAQNASKTHDGSGLKKSVKSIKTPLEETEKGKREPGEVWEDGPNKENLNSDNTSSNATYRSSRRATGAVKQRQGPAAPVVVGLDKQAQEILEQKSQQFNQLFGKLMGSISRIKQEIDEERSLSPHNVEVNQFFVKNDKGVEIRTESSDGAIVPIPASVHDQAAHQSGDLSKEIGYNIKNLLIQRSNEKPSQNNSSRLIRGFEPEEEPKDASGRSRSHSPSNYSPKSEVDRPAKIEPKYSLPQDMPSISAPRGRQEGHLNAQNHQDSKLYPWETSTVNIAQNTQKMVVRDVNENHYSIRAPQGVFLGQNSLQNARGGSEAGTADKARNEGLEGAKTPQEPQSGLNGAANSTKLTRNGKNRKRSRTKVIIEKVENLDSVTQNGPKNLPKPIPEAPGEDCVVKEFNHDDKTPEKSKKSSPKKYLCESIEERIQEFNKDSDNLFNQLNEQFHKIKLEEGQNSKIEDFTLNQFSGRSDHSKRIHGEFNASEGGRNGSNRSNLSKNSKFGLKSGGEYGVKTEAIGTFYSPKRGAGGSPLHQSDPWSPGKQPGGSQRSDSRRIPKSPKRQFRSPPKPNQAGYPPLASSNRSPSRSGRSQSSLRRSKSGKKQFDDNPKISTNSPYNHNPELNPPQETTQGANKLSQSPPAVKIGSKSPKKVVSTFLRFQHIHIENPAQGTLAAKNEPSPPPTTPAMTPDDSARDKITNFSSLDPVTEENDLNDWESYSNERTTEKVPNGLDQAAGPLSDPKNGKISQNYIVLENGNFSSRKSSKQSMTSNFTFNVRRRSSMIDLAGSNSKKVICIQEGVLDSDKANPPNQAPLGLQGSLGGGLGHRESPQFHQEGQIHHFGARFQIHENRGFEQRNEVNRPDLGPQTCQVMLQEPKIVDFEHQATKMDFFKKGQKDAFHVIDFTKNSPGGVPGSPGGFRRLGEPRNGSRSHSPDYSLKMIKTQNLEHSGGNNYFNQAQSTLQGSDPRSEYSQMYPKSEKSRITELEQEQHISSERELMNNGVLILDSQTSHPRTPRPSNHPKNTSNTQNIFNASDPKNGQKSQNQTPERQPRAPTHSEALSKSPRRQIQHPDFPEFMIDDTTPRQFHQDIDIPSIGDKDFFGSQAVKSSRIQPPAKPNGAGMARNGEMDYLTPQSDQSFLNDSSPFTYTISNPNRSSCRGGGDGRRARRSLRVQNRVFTIQLSGGWKRPQTDGGDKDGGVAGGGGKVGGEDGRSVSRGSRKSDKSQKSGFSKNSRNEVAQDIGEHFGVRTESKKHLQMSRIGQGIFGTAPELGNPKNQKNVDFGNLLDYGCPSGITPSITVDLDTSEDPTSRQIGPKAVFGSVDQPSPTHSKNQNYRPGGHGRGQRSPYSRDLGATHSSKSYKLAEMRRASKERKYLSKLDKRKRSGIQGNKMHLKVSQMSQSGYLGRNLSQKSEIFSTQNMHLGTVSSSEDGTVFHNKLYNDTIMSSMHSNHPKSVKIAENSISPKTSKNLKKSNYIDPEHHRHSPGAVRGVMETRSDDISDPTSNQSISENNLIFQSESVNPSENLTSYMHHSHSVQMQHSRGFRDSQNTPNRSFLYTSEATIPETSEQKSSLLSGDKLPRRDQGYQEGRRRSKIDRKAENIQNSKNRKKKKNHTQSLQRGYPGQQSLPVLIPGPQIAQNPTQSTLNQFYLNPQNHQNFLQTAPLRPIYWNSRPYSDAQNPPQHLLAHLNTLNSKETATAKNSTIQPQTLPQGPPRVQPVYLIPYPYIMNQNGSLQTTYGTINFSEVDTRNGDFGARFETLQGPMQPLQMHRQCPAVFYDTTGAKIKGLGNFGERSYKGSRRGSASRYRSKSSFKQSSRGGSRRDRRRRRSLESGGSSTKKARSRGSGRGKGRRGSESGQSGKFKMNRAAEQALKLRKDDFRGGRFLGDFNVQDSRKAPQGHGGCPMHASGKGYTGYRGLESPEIGFEKKGSLGNFETKEDSNGLKETSGGRFEADRVKLRCLRSKNLKNRKRPKRPKTEVIDIIINEKTVPRIKVGVYNHQNGFNGQENVQSNFEVCELHAKKMTENGSLNTNSVDNRDCASQERANMIEKGQIHPGMKNFKIEEIELDSSSLGHTSNPKDRKPISYTIPIHDSDQEYIKSVEKSLKKRKKMEEIMRARSRKPASVSTMDAQVDQNQAKKAKNRSKSRKKGLKNFCIQDVNHGSRGYLGGSHGPQYYQGSQTQSNYAENRLEHKNRHLSNYHHSEQALDHNHHRGGHRHTREHDYRNNGRAPAQDFHQNRKISRSRIMKNRELWSSNSPRNEHVEPRADPQPNKCKKVYCKRCKKAKKRYRKKPKIEDRNGSIFANGHSRDEIYDTHHGEEMIRVDLDRITPPSEISQYGSYEVNQRYRGDSGHRRGLREPQRHDFEPSYENIGNENFGVYEDFELTKTSKKPKRSNSRAPRDRSCTKKSTLKKNKRKRSMKRREESRESNQEERRLMGLHRNMLIKQYDKKIRSALLNKPIP